MKYTKILIGVLVVSLLVVSLLGAWFLMRTSGEPTNISSWTKVKQAGFTVWERGEVEYCDLNGDGQVHSKKIGRMEDGGWMWVDTNKDGFFDSVYEVTDAGDQFVKHIHIKVPSTIK